MTANRTTRRLAALAVALALTLTGCGGHHPAAHPDTGQHTSVAVAPLASPDPVSPWENLDTATGLAKAMHATGRPRRQAVIIAQEEDEVPLGGGHTVTLDRFSDPDVMNAAAGMMGGLGDSVAIINGHWTVSDTNRPYLTRLAIRYGWVLVDDVPQD